MIRLILFVCALSWSSTAASFTTSGHANKIIENTRPILIDSINISHVDDFQRGKVDALITYCSTRLKSDLFKKVNRIYTRKIYKKSDYLRGQAEQSKTLKNADLYAKSLITMQCIAIQNDLEQIKSI